MFIFKICIYFYNKYLKFNYRPNLRVFKFKIFNQIISAVFFIDLNYNFYILN
jgi:hypothetical protein